MLRAFTLMLPALAAACGTPDPAQDDPAEEGPLTFAPAATGVAALDATPDSDGGAIYVVGARDGAPALFRVDNTGLVVLHAGAPLVEPVNVSVSPADDRIYVADPGADAVLVFDAAGVVGDPVGEGLAPRGVHATDSGVLVVGAPGGMAALSLVDAAGVVTPLAGGAPLAAPSALVQTPDGTVYVTDSAGAEGAGAVIAVRDSVAQVLAGGLWLGDPAGISTTLDGSALVVSAIDPETGSDAVLLMDPSTGTYESTSDGIEDNQDGGGVHRAARANVWAWADLGADGGTAYRVQLR